MKNLEQKLGVKKLTKGEMQQVKGGYLPTCTLICYNPDDYENARITVTPDFCSSATDDMILLACDSTSGDTESAECDC